jgi:hypothetical protein
MRFFADVSERAVSMMYFFVFSPPKMTGAVSPAFWATSEKCTMGLAFALWDFSPPEFGTLTDCMKSQAQSPRKMGSRKTEKGSVINLQ